MSFDFQVALVRLLVKDSNMLRRGFLPFFVLLFLASAAGWGQAPMKVELCELVQNPQKYSQHWIEVRGAINLGFEDFTLRASACSTQDFRTIWLAYGGDEPTPTKSTVNDQTRKPGTVLKVNGIPVQLLRDAKLELFKSTLLARRSIAPDGSQCFDRCHFYDVTATFIGLFMAAPRVSTASFSGYGHMGCCHLLTIQQVT